jgi:glycosyltransferase involved in cell wall biosynthesis
MRVALVHYWLLGMRGGEKVIEALCRLFPEADIFTLFYDPEKVSQVIRSHRVTASFLNPLRRCYRSLLPLAPIALEHLDLRGYDLIISSESGPAKGIITNANSRHVCYCHSPMRYLWDLYPDYLHEWTSSHAKRALISVFSNYLRLWDYASASRVDEFLANSANVKRRIWKAYRRDSQIIYPPVDVESFYYRPPRDYFLVVSELVQYKRVHDAVICFSRTGHPLRIVGDGPEFKHLRKIAAPNVEFCGRVSAAELREQYARCRAVIQPGEEDFGMVSVEALASGKPVIALGKGGVLESVSTESGGGFFYTTPGDRCLEEAVSEFERRHTQVSSTRLQAEAKRFSEERFAEQILQIIYESWTDASPANPLKDQHSTPLICSQTAP